MLSFLLYKKPKGALYAKFDIPKRHGGTREIWAPDKDLKLVQHRLANLLQNCVEEINAGRGHVEDGKRHGVAHGFKRKHTIMTNARVHVTRRVPEGFQSEIVQVFDAVIDDAIALRNQDGEVAAIERWPVAAVIEAIGRDEFTLESALVTLDALLRRAAGG